MCVLFYIRTFFQIPFVYLFLIQMSKCGQFFLGGFESHKLHNKSERWHGKKVNKNFAFQVGMDNKGKFGVKKKSKYKRNILIESDNQVNSNLSQDLSGNGFDINNYYDIKSHFKSRMHHFQSHVLDQINNTHSVFIPELIRRINKNQVHYLKKRKDMVISKISKLNDSIRRKTWFPSFNHAKKHKSSFDIVDRKPKPKIKNRQINFYLKKNYLDSKKELPKYKHLKYTPSNIFLSKSKSYNSFR